ncbi:unnamed protein product [Paramecium sonneborni]|uniref:Uncharacterized protein n=1 Tax=Paramecium sonneborni TaxID=65129 RepID=A0A8S1L9A1_9CILI|nr:unnamed protein product [Paramecium sonneborni]
MSQSNSLSVPKAKTSLLSPLKLIGNKYQKVYEFYVINEEEILNITLNLSSKIKLVNAISEVLQQLCKEHPLDQNANNYDIYISKKNGKPKTDFPSFQADLSLEETGNNNFSLVHIAFQESKPKRKSTFDITNHYNQGMHKNQNENIQVKKKKNWLFNFLGCL